MLLSLCAVFRSYWTSGGSQSTKFTCFGLAKAFASAPFSTWNIFLETSAWLILSLLSGLCSHVTHFWPNYLKQHLFPSLCLLTFLRSIYHWHCIVTYTLLLVFNKNIISSMKATALFSKVTQCLKQGPDSWCTLRKHWRSERESICMSVCASSNYSYISSCISYWHTGVPPLR